LCTKRSRAVTCLPFPPAPSAAPRRALPTTTPAAKEQGGKGEEDGSPALLAVAGGDLWELASLVSPFFFWGTAKVAMKGVGSSPGREPFSSPRCGCSPRARCSSPSPPRAAGSSCQGGPPGSPSQRSPSPTQPTSRCCWRARERNVLIALQIKPFNFAV
jgi:hypothetical protein